MAGKEAAAGSTRIRRVRAGAAEKQIADAKTRDAFWSRERMIAAIEDFRLWAHPAQLEPRGEDWRIWLLLGGRGSGKTRAGAEWVKENVRAKRFGRIALIAPTMHDVREVIAEGPSGLCNGGYAASFEATRRRLVWPNGAVGYCYSAEDPESLRGPQFDAAWGDEFAYWSEPEAMRRTLDHAVRLGKRPLQLLTTTPRPTKALRSLVADKSVVVRTAATWTNASNLAPGFVSALRENWTDAPHDRQELLGELIETSEGALWSRADIEATRIEAHPPPYRVIVAVDPPVSVGPRSDACGIIAAGIFGEGAGRRVVVMGDRSAQGLSPEAWARRAAEFARDVGAETIVAEANNGGELVRTMLRMAAPDIFVRLVHARLDKRARAAPVAALYAQRKVFHAAEFAALEDEMCFFGSSDFRGSPDRLDALVWAVSVLMQGPDGPQLRMM
ncbi:MAG: terminase family protein [Caulobacterales bacterium]